MRFRKTPRGFPSKDFVERRKGSSKEPIVTIPPQRAPRIEMHHGDGSVDYTSALTLSKQKLALIQCDFDPKLCSKCHRFSKNLKTCAKCKMAKYCSRDCQSEDWEVKHKETCKEIRKLRETIEKEENKTAEEKTVPNDCLVEKSTKQWTDTLSFCDVRIAYTRMCMHGDRMVLVGRNMITDTEVVTAHDVKTDKRIAVVTQTKPEELILGMSSFIMPGKGTRNYKCAAITIGYKDDQMWRTEIYRYETKEPPIIMLGHPGGLGPMYAADGKLLALNPGQRFIAELEVRYMLVLETGLRIPIGLDGYQCVKEFVVLNQQGKKTIVLRYQDADRVSYIRCIEYSERGQLLWEMKPETMVFKGLIQFTPGCLTADPGSGRIYVADTEHGRIAWIDPERRTYHPIATMDGKIRCMEWCPTTQRLHLLHHSLYNSGTFISKMDVNKHIYQCFCHMKL